MMKCAPNSRRFCNTRSLTIFLCCLALMSGACTSMNPYRGPSARLLPGKTGHFERAAVPQEINKNSLKPDLTKGMLDAANVRYFRVDGSPRRNLGTSVFAFDSAARAKEAMQTIKEGYVKDGFKISAEGNRKKGLFTVGEQFIFTREPQKDRYPNGQTLAFWRNGSVMFYAESFSENQLEDVVEFAESFPN
jgi:hypothetical protein